MYVNVSIMFHVYLILMAIIVSVFAGTVGGRGCGLLRFRPDVLMIVVHK